MTSSHFRQSSLAPVFPWPYHRLTNTMTLSEISVILKLETNIDVGVTDMSTAQRKMRLMHCCHSGKLW